MDIEDVDISVSYSGHFIKVGELVDFQFENSIFGGVYFRIIAKIRIVDKDSISVCRSFGAFRFSDTEMLITSGGRCVYTINIRIDYRDSKCFSLFPACYGINVPMKTREFEALGIGDVFTAEMNFAIPTYMEKE